MSLSLSDISELLQNQGQKQYGMEAVNQLEHALQCADLAEKAGETPETIVAALLHDLGHMLVAHKQGHQHPHRRFASVHGLAFFAATVSGSGARTHPHACGPKRYLCLIDPGYWADLSSASQHSLELQGGTFVESEALAFMQQPYASEAVRLRRYDDLAKSPLKVTPPLSYFEKFVNQVAS